MSSPLPTSLCSYQPSVCCSLPIACLQIHHSVPHVCLSSSSPNLSLLLLRIAGKLNIANCNIAIKLQMPFWLCNVAAAATLTWPYSPSEWHKQNHTLTNRHIKTHYKKTYLFNINFKRMFTQCKPLTFLWCVITQYKRITKKSITINITLLFSSFSY